MIVASLVWGSPEWLTAALLIAMVAFAALVWGYWRSPGPRWVHVTAGFFKAIGIAALMICLLEPLYTGTRPRPGSNLFVLLADDSQSLLIRDPDTRQTRADLLAEHFSEETAWQTRLAQDFAVRRYRFADRLESIDSGDTLTAEGNRSSLVTALATIGSRFRNRPLAGILLLTDGNATDLPDEAVDWSELPPIYPVPLGGSTPAKDIAIQDVSVSQTNFEETPVTVRAEITASGYDDTKIVVALLDAEEKEIERRTVELPEDGTPRVVRFRIRPRTPGVTFYTLRASAESELDQFDTPEKSTEATLANNSRLVTVDRSGGPYRVLYVSGRANWEFKFLRRALASDAEVDLVGLIRVAKREPKFSFLGRGEDRANPLYKGFADRDEEAVEEYDQPVLIRVGTRDETELRDGFPQSADLLYEYDAVILDDVESGFFTQDQMLLLRKFVSDRGGGVLMLGGAESLRQGEYRHTPVGEMLPVYLDRQSPAPPDAQYRLTLTREGWLQPWIRLRETERDERTRLESMPPFETLNRVGAIKPGATVMANVTDAEGRPHPALIAQRFGKGRTASLLIGDMWRWQLKREDTDQDDLGKAWRQTVRWLVADVPRRVEIDVRQRPDLPNGPVELDVSVHDAEYGPLDNASVELNVTSPDGKELKLRAEASDDKPGVYRATYVPRQVGAYRAQAVVSGADGSSVGEKEAGWTSQPGAEEFRRLAPDLDLLTQIANATGGEVVDVDRLAQFVADLPNRKIPITEPWVFPLWHQAYVFLLAILCFCAEWGLRRWKGLP